jgi:hypothetical protein
MMVHQVQTDIVNGELCAPPPRFPRKVQMIKEDEAPPPMMATSGVVGGVPGGIPGGQMGGVIGGNYQLYSRGRAQGCRTAACPGFRRA